MHPKFYIAARLSAWGWLGALAVLAHTATAERVLVETNSLTAFGQAVRVYMHSVDLVRGTVLPLPAVLPGEAPLGPLLHTPDFTAAFLSTVDARAATGAADGRIAFTSQLQTVPLRIVANHAIARDGTWIQRAGAIAEDASEAKLVVLESRAVEDGAWEGRLSLYPIRTGEPRVGALPQPAAPIVHYPLPGPPERAIVLRESQRVAILGRGSFNTGSWLYVIDAENGERLLDQDPLMGPEGLAESDPGDMALSRDGSHVFVITSGFAADSPTGDPVSWLRVYDTRTLEALDPPLELPGLARLDEPVLEPDAGGGTWVATRWPVAGFAYVAHVRVTEAGAERDTAHSFTTTLPVRVAPSPVDGETFVAAGERLERWDAHGTLLAQVMYPSPIRVLRWTEDGVLAGEAGRLHRVDVATGESTSVIQFQSGHLTDVIVLPAASVPPDDPDGDGIGFASEAQLATDANDPDTDYDGIPDGIDAEPLRPSPLLQLPAALLFRGESAGREVKSFPINAHLGIASDFQIRTTSHFAPWLRVAPETGRTPARILVGIDPLHLVPSLTEPATAWIDVFLDGATPGRSATLSPQRVEVHVLPKSTGVRRVLWLWAEPVAGHVRGPSDPRGLKALADLLAGAPHYFSHQEHIGPFAGTLSPYSAVILGEDAAVRGVVNPHVLLEYVGQGGALLFLGRYNPQAPPESLRWLRPLGLNIDPTRRIDGIFSPQDEDGLARLWNSVAIRNGCAIAVTSPLDAVVRGSAESDFTVFSAKGYGRGRVATLASASPLETRAMADPSARQFAAALFTWLAQAGFDVADRDGDGLPDWLEDANANRVVDWGETNPDRADTDGDGIADGYEDANWNGILDEGETNPRKADSDSDGILDGADATPVPSPGAPLIAQIVPTAGPSHGGNEVVLEGAHLPAQASVWFGNRRSPRVQPHTTNEWLVQVPSASSPGVVDIRLTDVSGETIAVAPQAYTYHPSPELRVVLQTLQIVASQHGLYRGRTAVVLEGPAIDLRRVRVYLRAEPADLVTWGQIEQGRVAYDYGRRVTTATVRPDLIAIDLHEFPGRHLPMAGQLAVVNWTAQAPQSETLLRLVIDRAIAHVRNGEAVPLIPGEPLLPLKRTPRPHRAPE